MKKNDLPKKLAVFPLSNFIIFPKTSVPLNIFEPRYIEMINDSMNSNKLIEATGLTFYHPSEICERIVSNIN